MAFTRVQSTVLVDSNTATLALTFATPPTVGNAVVIPVTAYRPSDLVFPGTCTDNQGNTYAAAVYRGVSRGAVVYYCAKLTATGAPFTITISLGSFTNIYSGAAVEIGGVGAGGLTVDQTVNNYSVGTPASTPNTAPLSAADILLVAACAIAAAESSITVEAVTPPWVQEYEDFSNPSGEGNTRILTAGLGATPRALWAYAPTFAEAWSVLAAFKGAGAAPPAAVERAETFINWPM